MNHKNISSLFDRYIDKFELINNEEHNENSKWAAVNNFQKLFNVDAPDFSNMLKLACDSTKDIIDDHFQPFRGLVRMAEKNGESETIREMFKDLFSDDGGDLTLRQKKIDRFVDMSDELISRHYPGNLLYKNDQRSVMGYLWLYDPEHNFICRNTEAKYFARAVEFSDDWGNYLDFKIDEYYRFCEAVLNEIRNNEALMEKQRTGSENMQDSNEERNLHILLFDIIHSAFADDLYSGMKIRKYTMDQRKQFHENRIRGEKLASELAEAELQKVMLDEAIETAHNWADQGVGISHKIFGEGKVEDLDDRHITLQFPNKGITKKFQITSALGGGFIKFNTNEFEDFAQEYTYVLNHATSICNRLESLKKSLPEYLVYIS